LIVLLAMVPPGAPLRDPDTDNIVGNTPFVIWYALNLPLGPGYYPHA